MVVYVSVLLKSQLLLVPRCCFLSEPFGLAHSSKSVVSTHSSPLQLSVTSASTQADGWLCVDAQELWGSWSDQTKSKLAFATLRFHTVLYCDEFATPAEMLVMVDSPRSHIAADPYKPAAPMSKSNPTWQKVGGACLEVAPVSNRVRSYATPTVRFLFLKVLLVLWNVDVCSAVPIFSSLQTSLHWIF